MSSRGVWLSCLVLTGCLSDWNDGWDRRDERQSPHRPGVHDSTSGRTYYVRPSGDDASSGADPEQSWKSVSRVNAQDLEPGDTVLFEGGARFSGTLELDASDAGDAASPVRIKSFGTGRATLDAASGHGIAIHDAGGFEIENLLITGGWDASAQSGNDGEGIFAVNSVPGHHAYYLRFTALEVSGFKLAGIGLHARPDDDSKNSGFGDVEIQGCSLHGNGDAGLLSDGPYTLEPGYSHRGLTVRDVRVFDQRGLKNKGQHTGSGIEISDAEDALIEGCVAHDNGEYNDHPQGGAYGIWTWDSDSVTLRSNESYRNRTQTVDGGGFDIDGGVTKSIMQYNYSHDNAGPGYGAFQFTGARPFEDNVTQYNISQNDGLGHLLYDGNGDMGKLTIAQNVSYGATTSLTTYSGLSDIVLLNNIFYSTAEALADVYDGQGLTLQGNDYWAGDKAFHVRWNSGGATPVDYDSFEAYRDGTRNERFDGRDTGLCADPELSAAGSGGTLDDALQLRSLTMYQLEADSPLIDHGVDPTDFGAVVTDSDFFRQRSPNDAKDIGVAEAE
jgi:hypothetical protein